MDYGIASRVARVLIADAEPLFAQGLASLLADSTGIEVTGIASGPDEARALLGELFPSVLLVDTRMRGALDLISWTRKECPATRVLVLTSLDGAGHIVDAFAAGAGGYILKDSDVEAVAGAVRSLESGEAVMSGVVAERLLGMAKAKQGRAGQEDTYDSLTAREVEVLRLVASGTSYKQVAQRLNVTHKTVRNYISHIYEKLELYDRAQVTLYAVRKGLVQP